MQKKAAKKKVKKSKSPFTTTIYVHVRPKSREWVKRQAKLYGSESALIDALISNARGAKETEGFWLPKNSFTRKVRLNSIEV